MKRLCTLILALILGVSGVSVAGPDPGITKKIVNKNNNPDNWQWAPVWLIFDDNFRDQVLGEVVIATMRAYNDTTAKFVKLHTDATGNLKVVTSGASTMTIVGPLGSQLAAASVSTAPPTDARYQVSKDANVNSVGNTIWTTLSNGAAIIGAAVGAPLYVSVSKNTAANALTNPIYTQLSQDGTNAVDATHPIPISQDMAANALNNPFYIQVSQDGTNAVDATHPIPISQDMAANALNNPFYIQVSQDGTNAVDATHPLPISDDMGANTLGNTIKVELSDGVAAFADNTASPAYGRTQDGDSTTLADVEADQADGKATTLNSLVTSAVMYIYNGATLDMVRSGASGGMLVEVVTRAWEDLANGRINIFKAGTVVTNPAKTSTANVGTALVTVFASTEILGYPNYTIWFRNTSANAFVNANVYSSPDGAGTCGDANWVTETFTTCDTLAASATCKFTFTANSNRYVCAQVAGLDASRVTVDAWGTGNAN